MAASSLRSALVGPDIYTRARLHKHHNDLSFGISFKQKRKLLLSDFKWLKTLSNLSKMYLAYLKLRTIRVLNCVTTFVIIDMSWLVSILFRGFLIYATNNLLCVHTLVNFVYLKVFNDQRWCWFFVYVNARWTDL